MCIRDSPYCDPPTHKVKLGGIFEYLGGGLRLGLWRGTSGADKLDTENYCENLQVLSATDMLSLPSRVRRYLEPNMEGETTWCCIIFIN